MPFETKTTGKYAVVIVDEPRLDAAIAESFKGYLFEQIEGDPEAMVIDLASVRFMDSSGLGALVAALKKLSGKGALKLAGAQPAVRDLFDLTSMDKLFTIVSSVDEATRGE